MDSRFRKRIEQQQQQSRLIVVASQSPTSRVLIEKEAEKKLKNNNSSMRNQSSGGGFSLRRFILGAFLVAFIIFLINPQLSAVEAAKKKEAKKVLKTLVKGLIFKNLSTRKNFLPLPVPIPGKWQSILNKIADSGLFKDSTKHKKFSSSLAAAAAATAAVENSKTKIKKLNNGKQLSSLDSFKKYTRLTAARYASKIFNNHAPKKSSSLAKPAGLGDNNQITKAVSVLGTATDPSNNFNQKNDFLVTAFNLAKMIRQIGELNASKLFQISKKSIAIASDLNSINDSSRRATKIDAGSSSSSIEQNSLPIMNDNNRKTFIKMMNSIQTAAADDNNDDDDDDENRREQ